MADILLVEDNVRLVLLLRDRLRYAGHHVTTAADGATGLDLAVSRVFDCILLDVAMPKLTGLEVCDELRRRNVDTPILMLTARGAVEDRVDGLNRGADDYLTKPFEMSELLARLEALLRRSRRRSQVDVHHFGDIEVDLGRMQVRRQGALVELSDLELSVLRYLIEHRQGVVTREELLANVWKYDEPPLTRTVDVRVASLRQKLETDPARPRLIATVHGVGYRFVAE
jgi:two-component system alkaline phosphatase synthesis response regulator PhoP